VCDRDFSMRDPWAYFFRLFLCVSREISDAEFSTSRHCRNRWSCHDCFFLEVIGSSKGEEYLLLQDPTSLWMLTRTTDLDLTQYRAGLPYLLPLYQNRAWQRDCENSSDLCGAAGQKNYDMKRSPKYSTCKCMCSPIFIGEHVKKRLIARRNGS